MKHLLSCNVINKSPHINLKKLDVPLDSNYTINTLWILNKELTDTELTELLASIDEFCKINSLTILTKQDDHHLTISGTVDSYSKAFNTSFSKYFADQPGNNNASYHSCNTEAIEINSDWKDKVICILGLDNYPHFHTYHTVLKTLPEYKDVKIRDKSKTKKAAFRGLAPNGSAYFDPLQLATLYNFPANLNGTGQKVGIIELGGGYVLSDVTSYFSQLGLSDTPNIVDVGVDGATNDPNDGSGANIEVILDIEIVAAIVPKATINVYFAPNTYSGFYNAIKQAIDDNCNAISISWGAAEVYWSSSSLTAYDNLFKTAVTKGITITVASGDNGSKDGTSSNTVDFPSSSPNVLGCGGTRLVANSSKTTIISEVVWNNNSLSSATGGGISAYFNKPTYQNSVSYLANKRRGVPDICAVGDPATGYLIYSNGEGGLIVIGGTSAVAPLWAGLYARINQSVNGAAGFLNPYLYPHPSVCRDVVQGNNGGFTASTGWDACTGLGSPNGTDILTLVTTILNGDPVTDPTPTPTPPPPELPVVAFTANRTSGYRQLTVKFSNKTTNAYKYRWNFGDNTMSLQTNPVKTYKNPGIYTVTLDATNKNGTSTLVKKDYIIVSGPHSVHRKK